MSQDKVRVVATKVSIGVGNFLLWFVGCFGITAFWRWFAWAAFTEDVLRYGVAIPGAMACSYLLFNYCNVLNTTTKELYVDRDKANSLTKEEIWGDEDVNDVHPPT